VVIVVSSRLFSSVIPQSIRPELPIDVREKLLPQQQRPFAPTFFYPQTPRFSLSPYFSNFSSVVSVTCGLFYQSKFLA